MKPFSMKEKLKKALKKNKKLSEKSLSQPQIVTNKDDFDLVNNISIEGEENQNRKINSNFESIVSRTSTQSSGNNNHIIDLSEEPQFLHYVLNILQDNGIQPPEELEKNFNQIVNMLENKQLIKENKDLIVKLMNGQLSCQRAKLIIHILNNADLLDTETLSSCQKLMILPDEGMTDNSAFLLLSCIYEYVFLDKENLNFILELSFVNLARLTKIAEDLKYHDLLSNVSFNQALNKINKKLPYSLKCEVEKESRKQSNLSKSRFTLNNAMTFFVEPENSHHTNVGGHGSIKQAFETEIENEMPRYAIKTLNKKGVDGENEAIREVKYNILLGREAYYFEWNKKFRVVSEWQQGMGFEQVPHEIIQSMSYQDRLECFVVALQDINTLHENYRVHHDIKPHNFILNLEKKQLNLIDFGGAHKNQSLKQFSYTPEYNTEKGNIADDIKSLSIILAHFFPELYELEFSWLENVEIKQKDLSHRTIAQRIKTSFSFRQKKSSHNAIVTQAIVQLMTALQSAVDKGVKKCTSQDALNYCCQLLENFNSLNELVLKKIIQQTIGREEIIAEDVFRCAV